MGRRPTVAKDIADKIAAEIARGDLDPGDWLPTQETLCETHSASRAAVIGALRILAGLGLIDLHKNKGATVAKQRVPITHTPADQLEGSGPWRGLLAGAYRAGKEPFTTALSVGDVEAPTEVAERMGVQLGTTVLRRVRLQGVVENGQHVPCQLSTAWFNLDVVGGIPELRQPPGTFVAIRDVLVGAGLTLSYRETVASRDATAEERERLELPSGSPCVHDAWRVCREQSGRVVDVTRRVVNPGLVWLEFTYP